MEVRDDCQVYCVVDPQNASRHLEELLELLVAIVLKQEEATICD